MNQDNSSQEFYNAFWSLHLLNTFMSELKSMYRVRSDKHQLDILNEGMFKIFHSALMYATIMEYCKLLEASSSKENNVASLEKLVEATYSLSEKRTYDFLLDRIVDLRTSKFALKMRKLRDKKYAHTDKNLMATPFKIQAFNEDEMIDLERHFVELNAIFQHCASKYSQEYEVRSNQDYLENFVKKYGKIREYYKTNNTQPWFD